MAAIPRLDNPDPYATNTQGCAVYSRSGHYHEYRFPAKITETTIEDPMEVRRVERSLGLRLNRAQCERFLDPDVRFFAQTYNRNIWYDESEFLHESELRPIKGWSTRYLYNIGGYGSAMGLVHHAGPDRIPESEARLADLQNSFVTYSLQNFKEDLQQFSNDGYYFDPETGIRWRIMLSPALVDGRRSLNQDDVSPFILIDESGQYMPRGMPSIKYRLYRYHCTEDYVCGYQRNEKPLVRMSSWIGDVSTMRSRFSPVRIEEDRITILQRVSTGEPFLPNGQSGEAKLVLHATFSDPIRPVYFAPGLLLKDASILERRTTPRSDDFIEHEVCVADCPGEVAWQYGAQRMFDESHP